MKQWLMWGALLSVSLVLQCTLLPQIALGGAPPDLLLVVVVLASLHLGQRRGAMIGFSAGLLQDLYSGTFIGFNAFTKLLTAYLFGLAERQVFQENLFMPLAAAGAATVGNYFLQALLMALLGYRFSLGENMATLLLPLLVYQVALALPVHLLIGRISGKGKE